MSELNHPLALSGDAGIATVYDQGAHVASWTPFGHDPVLFVSRRSGFQVGTSIRGGIPVCFPWFGPGRTGEMTPAHGFARITEWHLDEQGQDDAGNAFASFSLTPQDVSEQLRESFPYEFSATLRMTVGSALCLDLRVTNTGDETFEIEEALHTYLSVGDATRVRVHGLDGVTYHDKVTGEQRTQSGDLTITGETDAVFAHRGEVRVLDPALGRTLVVSKEGSDSTVVWNPWQDKAVGMSDFADDEWQRMLCVEAGNVMGSPVRLAAGESHVLVQSIEVEPLAEDDAAPQG